MNVPSSSSKSSSLQSYQMAIFRGAIHPEFFPIESRRRIQQPQFDFEAWLFKGGHVVRFEHSGVCVTEVVEEDVARLPERGHVTTLPCAGERDHEQEFTDRIGYVTSIQTEQLTGHLYLSTYNEMLEHGRQPECLMSTWDHDGGEHNLSVMDVQRYHDEVHVQSYHLRADCGLVLRTQTILQAKDVARTRVEA